MSGRAVSYDCSVTKVLIVEPDEPLMRMLGWILIDAGFAVVCTGDFDEALRRLPEVRPDITVLDGDSAENMCADPIGAVRTRWGEGRVIDLQRPSAPQMTTADATLRKPFHADSLVATIRELSGELPSEAETKVPSDTAKDVRGESLPASTLWSRMHKQHRRNA
jgi:DNA-binding response OmpR family regulator